jgi:predicted short-subunit dehydrogenase-like oxidoreductase (DUF2520 family)
MIDHVRVVGAAGRVGKAVSARLAEQGLLAGDAEADLVLLCVPDRAIRHVAVEVAPGPWIAHVSGATPLAQLAPHRRRFGLHPLQTFTHRRGPDQLDGAWAAITAEEEEGAAVAAWLAERLGLRAFRLADERRVLYHAGAAIAANYLVTLRKAAGALLATAGAPPEALDPLMTRAIENEFELTGPIDRGDWPTVASHLAAIQEEHPELEELYVVLARATAMLAGVAVPAEALPETVEAIR